jgi:hypothetical protein
MASETFFDNGDRVKFSKGWWSRRKHEKALMKLRGQIVGCNDSGRECYYYYVEWEATDAELELVGLQQNDSYQSDALAKVRKKAEKRK